MELSVCPLCNTPQKSPEVLFSYNKEFYSCGRCSLIYRPKTQLPSPVNERNRYQQHHNDASDKGYQNFLQQAITPVHPYLSASSRLLDFGCGPTQGLSQLLATQGYQCHNYDPFFSPQIPGKNYDVIFCTETFEHFHNPAKEIKTLSDWLKPGGLLVVMTEFYKNREQFKNWWYTRDFTHVCFYHLLTFNYISQKFGFQQLYSDDTRVVVLQKL